MKPSERDLGGFAWRLEPDPGAIPYARRAFEDWLRGSAAIDDHVHDMAVVFSELASNAVTGAAAGTAAHVRAGVDGDELRLEVTNRVDDDVAAVKQWNLDDPLRGGGRGLLIVRAYTDSMEVESSEGSVTVRCALRLGAPT